MNNLQLKLDVEFSGEIPETERHIIIEAIKNGLAQHISNCGILGDDADEYTKYIKVTDMENPNIFSEEVFGL